MIETCVWCRGSLQAVESAILRLRAAEDSSSEKSRSQPERNLPQFSRKKDVEKRGYTILHEHFCAVR